MSRTSFITTINRYLVSSLLVCAFALPIAIANNSAERDNDSQDVSALHAYELAELIEAQKLSSQAVVEALIDRIKQLDRTTSPPKNSSTVGIQAIIQLNPDALELAKTLDDEAKEGRLRGPLHGVPVVVKDNIETSNMPTTAGSMALMNNDTKRDAPIIARLKSAGAIILAKTNLSEWANFRDADSVSGWSGVGGQTRNPHSLDRTPCGSSSGTGAAIAAQYAPLGIGTETNGSIICPSTMNGIVGFKPTVGLVSRSGIVPISVTQDTAGPMTRSVKDAALMLHVMSGTDANDPASLKADEYKQDYIASLNTPLKGKRIGVFRAVQSEHTQIIAALDEAVETLKNLGVEIVDIEEYETPEGFWPQALQVLLTEFKHELNRYLANAAPEVEHRDLKALIEYNQSTPRELSVFGQSLFIDAQATEGYDDSYQEALAFLRKTTREEGIDRLLNEQKLDAIMMPSQTPAFLIDPVYGDSFPGGFAGAGWMAAIAGYPHVSVPMGSMKGLPIGLSFMGAQWDDASLLNIAYQYEQASQKRITPQMSLNAFENAQFKQSMKPLNE
ncbi:amidase [Ningiella sp. W23]|uniref:amidase n=1 Tax=Ningiella sp. W23 TaxID=3023715 RepID=UPI003757CCC6